MAQLARVFLPFVLAALVILPMARRRTSRRRCSISSTRCWSSSSCVVLVLGSLALDALHRRPLLPVGALTRARVRRGAVRARGAVEPARRLRRPAHLLLALPALGGHALRAVDAARGRAGRDRGRFAPLPRAGAARGRRLSRGCAAGAGSRPTAKAPSASPTATRRASATTTWSSPSTPRVRLSPALFLHMRLLAQVVGEFYEGKRRESALRADAYLQAVHETGARLTHDIKNLLQSLYALTSMAPKEAAEGYAGLLQRQLPQLTRRLHATLEKLRAPGGARRRTCRSTRATGGPRSSGAMAGGDVSLEARSSPAATVPARALRQPRRELPRQRARQGAARARRRDRACASRHAPGHVELAVSDTGTRGARGGRAQRCFASRSSARAARAWASASTRRRARRAQAGYRARARGQPRRRGVLPRRAARQQLARSAPPNRTSSRPRGLRASRGSTSEASPRASRSTGASWRGARRASGTRCVAIGDQARRVTGAARRQRSKIARAKPNHVTSPGGRRVVQAARRRYALHRAASQRSRRDARGARARSAEVGAPRWSSTTRSSSRVLRERAAS